jgi:hypothetical protein
MTYTLLASGSIQRDADGATIPQDSANRDYAEFLAWVAAGNTPRPAPRVLVQSDTTFGDSPWLL